MSELFTLGIIFLGFCAFVLLAGPVLFRVGERVGQWYGRYVDWVVRKL